MTKEERESLVQTADYMYVNQTDKWLLRFMFSIGSGWVNLVKEALEKIKALDTKKEVVLFSVKSKFGGLRIYITGTTNDEIHKVIERAELDSFHICEICGATEAQETRINGWIWTLCPKCLLEKGKDKYE